MRQIVPIFFFNFKTKHIFLTNYDQIGVGEGGELKDLTKNDQLGNEHWGAPPLRTIPGYTLKLWL